MSGFAAYKMFAAMRLHFTTDSYDYFKYRGNLNRSQSAFESNKDAWRYEKIARDYSDIEEMTLFMACNFAADDSLKWVGALHNAQAQTRYLQTRGALDSLRRWFKEEMSKLFRDNTQDSLFAVNSSPVLARLVLQGEVSPLLPVILDRSVMRFLPYWRDSSNNEVVRSLASRLIKYQPFVASQRRPELVEIYTAARDGD